MNYQDKLRRFADYLDDHPGIPINDWDSPNVWVTTKDAASFGTVCKAMGDFTKNSYEGMLEAAHTEVSDDGPTVFTLRVTVSGVCKKVETGEVKTRKVHIPKGAVQNADEEWEISEPVATYDCPDSFLNLANPTE